MAELKTYDCHKTVRAGKISAIVQRTVEFTDLHVEGMEGFSVIAPRAWMEKHQPEVGGYYVQYNDGYASYSPAAAFEEGYTLSELNQV
jgi:hypothetical protein